MAKALNANSLLPVNIIDSTINALYNAGMSIVSIGEKLNMDISEIKKYLPKDCSNIKSNVEPNNKIINEILYNNGNVIAKNEIINIEKKRWDLYNQIENRALKIMDDLLRIYALEPTGQDLKIDAFKAQLASNFIRETQKTRDELYAHYGNRQSDIKLKVEFI